MRKVLYICFASLVIGQPAFADSYADSEADIAEEAAEELGDALADRLEDERSKVVFINMSHCSPSVKDDDHWCHLFLSRVQAILSKEGIRFLGESHSADIRKKIIEEQVYQHDSKQVDIAKAVALGKQDAFQAFVSLVIDGSEHTNTIRITAQSIQIKLAATSISLSKTVRIKKTMVRSWGHVFTGWLIIGAGAAGAYRGYELQQYHKQHADDAYSNYQDARDEEDVVRYRKESERHDEKAKLSHNATIAGLVIAGIGGLYLLGGQEETLSYSIASQDTNGRQKKQRGWDIQPVIAPDNLGLALAINW